jgi:hypothetical protein
LVSEAEANAAAITQEAEAKAAAMTQGASARARDVARAALSESELLVVRIEQIRAQVQQAEDALRALSGDGGPRLEEARRVLDTAMEAARSSAENPELLAAAATPPPQQPAAGSPMPPETPAVPTGPAEGVGSEAPQAPQPIESIEQPTHQEPVATVAHEVETEPEVPPAASDATRSDEQASDVEQSDSVAESSADISDKVDRLLEELREVT